MLILHRVLLACAGSIMVTSVLVAVGSSDPAAAAAATIVAVSVACVIAAGAVIGRGRTPAPRPDDADIDIDIPLTGPVPYWPADLPRRTAGETRQQWDAITAPLAGWGEDVRYRLEEDALLDQLLGRQDQGGDDA